MFAKVYNFKFPGLSEAKVAATFCSERLGKKIVPFNIRSLNISIGKCGSISINLKFESGEDLNKFEESSKEFFQDLKKHSFSSKVIFPASMFIIMTQK